MKDKIGLNKNIPQSYYLVFKFNCNDIEHAKSGFLFNYKWNSSE